MKDATLLQHATQLSSDHANVCILLWFVLMMIMKTTPPVYHSLCDITTYKNIVVDY